MDFEKARFNMVEQQIRPWDVLDFDVLDALEEIPRELFADESLQGLAYADMELPLANGHKMLEPKVVARLAQGLKLTKNDTVLEIGTGSGYATALLAKLAGRVVSTTSMPNGKSAPKRFWTACLWKTSIMCKITG